MPLQNTQPKTLNITGANLTGSDGASNRTYTLSAADVTITVFGIVQQGIALHENSDYSVSGKTITFLNSVYDADLIHIAYFESTQETSVSGLSYTTELGLSRFMHLLGDTTDTGDNTVLEDIGERTVGKSKFLLDHRGPISDTYSLYYGTSEILALANTLTETTHYSLDLETGILTLTNAGTALVGTANIYSSYKYNTEGITSDEITNALARAEAEVDRRTNNHFATGTASPDYVQVTNEEHPGKGRFDRTYFAKKRPLPNVTTTLTSDVAASDTTLNVASTSGFLSSGYLLLGSEKLSYSGKTATTFTGVATVATSHSEGDELVPFIMEISTTDEGSTPTWTVLALDTEFNVDLQNGTFYIYDAPVNTDGSTFSYPSRLVPNRVRLTYISGESTIPTDLVRACYMIASRDIMHKAVRKATASGQNEFKPELVDVDDKWINDTLDRYRNQQMGNT